MASFQDLLWARAGKASRARAEAVREPVRRAVAASAERGLDGVPFASPQARTKAKDGGLSWFHFEDEIPASPKGFTVGDVKRILERVHG